MCVLFLQICSFFRFFSLRFPLLLLWCFCTLSVWIFGCRLVGCFFSVIFCCWFCAFSVSFFYFPYFLVLVLSLSLGPNEPLCYTRKLCIFPIPSISRKGSIIVPFGSYRLMNRYKLTMAMDLCSCYVLL